MTGDRWDRIADLFDSALELPRSERSRFVQRAAADDLELLGEVESLLAADGEGAIIDIPPAEAFAELIDDGLGVRAGDLIGPYRIDSLLGAGGMGEVYRAHDTNLNRDVAIKILPAAFANDPERLARFKREAQVLAAVQHPNIAVIYGLEERPAEEAGSAPGTAIVMELVDGLTLAERLAGGRGGGAAMPLAEAIVVAQQIADAVQTAHEQGIIHRDLKPANIKIRSDGTVKVLDFGLAKIAEAVQTAPTAADHGFDGLPNSPTVTTPGMILGTASYMSPEQVKGRPADRRSDIWAFGCVFFEMLTGARPFDGEDRAETLAAILKQEPDWSRLPPLSPTIEVLLRRCLEKDLRRRLSDMSTVRFLLSDALPARTEPQPKARRLGSLVAAAAAGAAVALLVTQAVREGTPFEPSPVASRFVTAIPSARRLADTGRGVLALSPDGRRLAYVANGQLWLRSLEERDARSLADADHAVVSPAFSPDGRALAFWHQGAILRVAFDGGSLTRLYPVESMPYGIHWSTDGIFAAVQVAGSPLSGTRIIRLDPETGAVLRIAQSAEGETFYGPWPLPDGLGVLVTIADSQLPGRWETSDIILIPPSGERRVVVTNASDARLLPTGHLAYSVGGVVFAQPFDMRTLTVSGTRVAVLEGVGRGAPSTAASHYEVSQTGTLVFVPGPQTIKYGARSLAAFATRGEASPLSLPPDLYEYPRVSPEGRRLTIATNDDNSADVWVYDLDGRADRRRLTVGGRNRFPIWTHDARRIAYQSDRAGDRGIFWQAADGTGGAERLTSADGNTAHVPAVWSPSGDAMLFEVVTPEGFELWSHSVSTGQSQRLIATTSGAPFTPVFSPDGRWLAYHTQQESTSGQADARNTVWVRPYPVTDDVYEVSSEGTSHHPAWTADGRAVMYTIGAGQFRSREIQRDRGFALGMAQALGSLTLPTWPADAEARPFDVLPDNRFVAATNPLDQGSVGIANATEIEVVLNWFAELRSKFRAP